MTTTTLSFQPARTDWRNPWATLFSLNDGVDTRKLHGTSRLRDDVEALLDRAQRYEGTQPSFAADLRAAAAAKLDSI